MFLLPTDVREFPEGATPVDFAYAVHTQLGKSVRGRQSQWEDGAIKTSTAKW